LFPETHQVWAETEQRYGQRIRALSPEHRSVEAWVARHGIDGFRAAVEARQGCCSVRKVEPLRRALAQASAWITGLCAEQSADRAVTAYAALDPAYHLLKVNPLLDWTRERVLDFVRQHDIPYNRLHDRGFLSIGCAPCTRAVAAGEPERAGRWWWEQDEKKECGCIATMRLPPASSAGSRWQPQQIRNNAVHGVISAGRAGEAFAGAKNAPHRLSQLAQLEAESIYILREAIAESDNPVLLYSIGKDSAVLLHLALKAFHPGKPPFPLLHIDTTWKFREMIAFRDRRARELGLDLIVHTNAEGLARGINPVTHGPELHTDVMKTQALR
jgi:phosphoadenylyl-sulfate reductase (thioredoxin)